ncbi:MAG: PHP domain-containing protein, partial [Marinicaulis sp.]|nr:PHP domain-containing protein [Marinicaulis sp.]
MSYAELCVRSNFTFLTGASHPDELAVKAHELGLKAIAVADKNTLAGVVRAHAAAKEVGVQYIVGARIVLADETEFLVFPEDRAGYGRLCRLLTVGKRRTEKG